MIMICIYIFFLFGVGGGGWGGVGIYNNIAWKEDRQKSKLKKLCWSVKAFHHWHDVSFFIANFEHVWPCHMFNPIQDGYFWGCSLMGEGKKTLLPKICDTYPAMMKLGTVIPYLQTSAFFHQKSVDFIKSRNTDIDCILVHNF